MSNVQDKVVAFIASCGAAGADALELARKFLAPASAPAALCEKLIAACLADDPRVMRRPDGRWTRVRGPGAAAQPAAYTIIESLPAQAGGRILALEWAACRVDEQGRVVETRESPIRPDPWPKDLITPAHLRGKINNAPVLSEAVAQACEFAAGSTLVSLAGSGFISAVASALEAEGRPAEVLSLERFCRTVLGQTVRTPEAIAAALKIPTREMPDAAERCRFAADALAALLACRESLSLGEPEEWTERQRPKRLEPDYSRYEFDRQFIEALPEGAGVYVMRDANGAAIYVGKAANLRRRIRGYFSAMVRRDEKTERILESVWRLQFHQVGSELAALLLEFRTIRKLQPAINIQFEVHERPAASKEPHRRLVLVLPAAEKESAEVFLLHGDRAMERVIVPRQEPEKLRPSLEKFFFGRQPPEPAPDWLAEEMQIAWSWIEHSQDRISAFAPDLAGGLDGAMRLVASYLAEEAPPEKVIHV